MPGFKFNVPLHLKDLVGNEGRGEYSVRQEYSVRDLKSKLNVSFIINI